MNEEDKQRILKLYCTMMGRLGLALGMAEGLGIQTKDQKDIDDLTKVAALCSESLERVQYIVERVSSNVE